MIMAYVPKPESDADKALTFEVGLLIRMVVRSKLLSKHNILQEKLCLIQYNYCRFYMK